MVILTVLFNPFPSALNTVKPESEPLSWKFWRKRRYIVVLMSFCGFFNVYSLRVNLSVAIVAMTENRTVYYPNGTVGYVSIMITNSEAWKCGTYK